MTPTNFSGGLSVDGVPVLGGGGSIPFMFGNYYFVDATNGSDGNDGRSLITPLKTIAQAMSLCTAGNNDVIVLQGNSHSLTAMLTVKARTHIVGTGGMGRMVGQSSKITMPVTTSTADVTGIDMSGARSSLNNIKIESINTLTQAISALKVTCEGGLLNNVMAVFTVRLNQTTCCDAILASDSTTYNNCTFGDMTYHRTVARPTVVLGVDASTPAKSNAFNNCNFITATTNAGAALIQAAGATNCVDNFNIFRGCVFSAYVNAGSGAVAIDAAIKMNSSTTGDLVFDANTICTGCTAFSVATSSANNGVYICAPVPTAATSGIAVVAA
jgi:hypothetical protein